MSSKINWNDVIKKEARDNNYEELGEVQEVKDNDVIVQRGIIKKEIFYIPKDQAESYDNNVLKFKFSEQELSKYQDEPSFQDTEINTTKMEEEITVQDADFKNKAKAVKNKKEVTGKSSIPLKKNRIDVSEVSKEIHSKLRKSQLKKLKQ
ncbi:MAG TPA: hypothetical protein VK882_04020 [Nitrososphaeraceae archaeon]|jgi:hypothetical protein|nr:hypothetical protein [Nitrososphaeraceae archaeon]